MDRPQLDVVWLHRSRRQALGPAGWALWLFFAAFLAAFHPALPPEAIRLRVVAHSDHPRDQAIKAAAAAAVLAVLAPAVSEAEAEGPAAVRQAVLRSLPAVAASVERVLRENGAPYGARIAFGRQPFPAKPFGDRWLPAGDTEALVVTLGAGRGHNLWCVFFPSLCLTREAVRPKALAAPPTEGPGKAGAKDGAAAPTAPKGGAEAVGGTTPAAGGAHGAPAGAFAGSPPGTSDAASKEAGESGGTGFEVRFFFLERLMAWWARFRS
ncbi:stage II sporulation protein R [Hydrogenibacillus sp. N12]|uniref:stage II sporulation protein R n=1 Tax=Hydrogenibacillus sp. N12 TaxID=2866627 RepID=UPI00207BE529|nr:stage II sporulation protein R [Hydrogenibacillus sp. N12]